MLNLLKKTLHEISIPYEKKISYLFLLRVAEGSRGKETQGFLLCDGTTSFYELTKFWVPATVSFSGLAGIYHSRLNVVQSSTRAIWALLLGTMAWAPKSYHLQEQTF